MEIEKLSSEIDKLSLEDLSSQANGLRALLASKEIELRQLEQMEKRLLDSQGKPDAEEGNEVKDLNEILGDFQPNILRQLQALLLLEEMRSQLPNVKEKDNAEGKGEVESKQEEEEEDEDEDEDDEEDEESGQDASKEQRKKEKLERLNKKGCIGLDLMYEQVGETFFNLMICGSKGVGKTTLFHSLFNLDETNEVHGKSHLEFTEALVKENGYKVRVSCLQADPRNTNFLLAYINDLQQDYFTNELRQFLTVNPTRFTDKRIHCCLYLFSPQGHSKPIKESDIRTMKLLSERTNLIPVIAKSDTLTKAEVANYKKKIVDAIKQHKIQVFKKGHYKHNQSKFPFAVVASNKKVTNPKGELVMGRQYPWGTVDVEDPEMCDFAELRKFVIRTNFASLLELTHSEKYAAFKIIKHNELRINDQQGGGVGSRKANKKRATLVKLEKNFTKN